MNALELDELRKRYGGEWGEHPNFLVSDWKIEVAEDETWLGYWAWVESEIAAKVEDMRLPDGWETRPKLLLSWKREVAENNTRLGYWTWIEAK